MKQIIRKATHVVKTGTAKIEMNASDRSITTAVDVIPRAGCFMTAVVSHWLAGGARGPAGAGAPRRSWLRAVDNQAAGLSGQQAPGLEGGTGRDIADGQLCRVG
jgi:hypothetical protein